MNVKKMVIHTLEKQVGYKSKLIQAPKELLITPLHQEFMDNVRGVYYKKSNPIYGIFNPAKDEFPYQSLLQGYLDGSIEFLDFTTKAIRHFQYVIDSVTQASGGYVLFCHFDSTEEFVATIMLNDKLSYMITDQMDLNQNSSLDIEKLDVANFTNCDKWANADDIYLSFTRGKKDVSQYFMRFIGCTNYTSAKETSENLKKALNDYLDAQGYSKDKKDKIKSSVFAYCENRMKAKQDLNLGFISSLVDHDEPHLFQEYASTEKYQISANFKGHKTLRNLKYYGFKSEEFSIEFDSRLLGGQIKYDEKKNQLLVKDIPKELGIQLSRTVAVEDDEA